MSEVHSLKTDVWHLDEDHDPAEYPNGFFKLSYTPPPDVTPDEVSYFNVLTQKINDLVQTCGRAADRTERNADVQNQVREVRYSELKELAEELCDGLKNDREAFEEYGRIEGLYYAQRANAKNRVAASMRSAEKSDDADARVWMLKLEDLQEGATPEQIALSIDIQRAYDVVDIVMDRRQIRADQPGARKQGLVVRKNYVGQLKEIADEGLLSRALTAYAARKLELFKDAFVQREADRVKNQHVKALGFWTARFIAIFLILATILEIAIREGIMSDLINQFKITQNFMFLAIGASVGTWMSFTLRKVELGFDDLVLLEPDRLNPAARIIFVVILTCVIGGILQLGWVTITFSDSKALAPDGGVGHALLLGILCGIAERSLSGAILGRANTIASVVRPAKTTKDGSDGE